MSIDWTGPNQGKLRKALLEIYGTTRALKRFVRDHFEHSLTDIADSGSPEDWAEDLLAKAAAKGWLDDLYGQFCRDNVSRSQVAQLRRDLQDDVPFIPDDVKGLVSREQVIGDPNFSNAVVRMESDAQLPACVEDPCSTHLVIAVFWQERSKQKLRVQPKLCYRAGESPKILCEPLQSALEKDCVVLIEAFPDSLEKLVEASILKLSVLFPDPSSPFKLRIALFLPVDLLSVPLSRWCRQKTEWLRRYPIVIGCSDRFDLSQPGEAVHLHNQLKLGWRRFQENVPDGSGKPLKKLTWLSSKMARKKSFASYSGFKCYGHCLKPGEEYLQHWSELVQSGIPVALWMCEGHPQEGAIATIFNRLIQYTRFEFLDQIPLIRDEQQKTCNHCVGVFYEDPNYLPDVPRSEPEQFLSWPGA